MRTLSARRINRRLPYRATSALLPHSPVSLLHPTLLRPRPSPLLHSSFESLAYNLQRIPHRSSGHCRSNSISLSSSSTHCTTRSAARRKRSAVIHTTHCRRPFRSQLLRTIFRWQHYSEIHQDRRWRPPADPCCSECSFGSGRGIWSCLPSCSVDSEGREEGSEQSRGMYLFTCSWCHANPVHLDYNGE